MSTDLMSELKQFHRYISDRLGQDGPEPSPEQALDEWRAQHPSPDELAEDVAAIREVLADMAAGDTGIPFGEFDREFRARHNLTPQS
ncbi:MAG: hypothetical protein HZA46_20025 [Planctomycetales bacterium]|nr:hypothetical protein [Planctomycetales bacterium]